MIEESSLLSGTLRGASRHNIETLFDMLSLNKTERKVILATASGPHSTASLARMLREPRHRIKTALANLHDRGLVQQVGNLRYDNRMRLVPTKAPYWASDLRRATARMHALTLPAFEP